MQLNDFNIFTVNTFDEFKDLEQKLFSTELTSKTDITIVCLENKTFYYYTSVVDLGKWRLVTDGERSFS